MGPPMLQLLKLMSPYIHGEAKQNQSVSWARIDNLHVRGARPSSQDKVMEHRTYMDASGLHAQRSASGPGSSQWFYTADNRGSNSICTFTVGILTKADVTSTEPADGLHGYTPQATQSEATIADCCLSTFSRCCNLTLSSPVRSVPALRPVVPHGPPHLHKAGKTLALMQCTAIKQSTSDPCWHAEKIFGCPHAICVMHVGLEMLRGSCTLVDSSMLG